MPPESTDSALLQRLQELEAGKAELRAQLADRDRALALAAEREAALADVLRIIRESPGDIDIVLPAIGYAAGRLCQADHTAISSGTGPMFEGARRVAWDPVRGLRTVSTTDWGDLGSLFREALERGGPVQVAGPVEEWAARYPVNAALTRADGLTAAAILVVPFTGRSGLHGQILLRRSSARPFDADDVRLVERFADQAVVAIENAGVLADLRERNREMSEALERERATSEVLEVINRSQADLQPVLDRIAVLAGQLTNSIAGVVLATPSHLAMVTSWLNSGRVSEASLVAPYVLPNHGAAPATLAEPRGSATAVAIRDGRTIHLHGGLDAIAEQWPGTAAGWRPQNYESGVIVPLVLKDVHWGAIHVARTISDPYTPEQISLLETFAGQAAIAIENARLLAELRDSNERTNEALEVQQVMAKVLAIVASSPSNLDAVLPEIGAAAARLTASDFAVVNVLEGTRLHNWDRLRGHGTREFSLDPEYPWYSMSSEAIAVNRMVEVMGRVDEFAKRYPGATAVLGELGLKQVSSITVPLPGPDGPIGSIAAMREQLTPYSEAHKSILRSLADQAVIAIQNARMFGDLEQRNLEITEALRREEATSEILRQISNAPEQIEETLQAISDATKRLTGLSAAIWTVEGTVGVVRGRSLRPGDPGNLDVERGARIPLVPDVLSALTSRLPHVQNYGDQRAIDTDRPPVDLGTRSWAMAPIVRGDELIGFLSVSDHSGSVIPAGATTLLAAFADQAAVAIENARLIRELRESNREISENLDVRRVMGEVLAIVASAPSDLRATLPRIAKAAAELTDADIGTAVSWIEGSTLVICASGQEGLVEIPWDPDGAIETIGQQVIRDAREVEWRGDHAAMRMAYPMMAQFATVLGRIATQSVLSVPMFSAAGAFGALTTIRHGLAEFPERARSVLRALATQAVVAIENARLFRELQEKTEALEIASRHKSEFLANMSHELRTPLNAIIGYAELLQEECEDLGQEDFLPDLGKIHSAGRHLLTLISGILDLSKVEAGRMTMFLEDIDIATLIRDAEAIVRPLVEKNGNTFVIDCPDDIGVMHADLVKVRQVLFNLLSNSAKFTEAGRIILTVRKHADDATVTFAIRDTGIGMTEDQVGRLFEAFSQANAETSRKYGGTGLGLALSREFCRMMGGDIAVVSQAGAGSTFTVTLPVRCIDTEIGS